MTTSLEKEALELLRKNISEIKVEITRLDSEIKEKTSLFQDKNCTLGAMIQYEKHLSLLTGEDKGEPIKAIEQAVQIIRHPRGNVSDIVRSAVSQFSGDFTMLDLADKLSTSGLNPGQIYKGFKDLNGEVETVVPAAGRRAGVYRKKSQ